MIEIEFITYYVILGGVVGFMAGLLGVGGGGIMVPILSMLFIAQGVGDGEVMHLALGTSMATIIFTSFASMRAHYKQNNVEVSIVYKIAIGIVIGTFLATFLASIVSGKYLAIFFTIFMSYVAYSMFFKRDFHENKNPHKTFGNVIAGLIIGAISALVSIGGGSLNVPYLMSQNFDMKRAIGTSAAIGFPIAISGTLGYMINGYSQSDLENLIVGYVYLPAVLIIAIMSFITAPLGVKVSVSIPVGRLKKIFGLLIVGLSVKMLLSVV